MVGKHNLSMRILDLRPQNRTIPGIQQSAEIQHNRNVERGTHFIPRTARASFLSIFALKPPLAHSWAAPLPPRIPLLTRERPAIAAAIAPTPRIIGVDIGM